MIDQIFEDSNAISRRRMLMRAGTGFGMLGLASLLDHQNASAANANTGNLLPHFAPKAKRVIFLFMNGAPSHVDTFDPKPALAKHAGKEPPGEVERKAQKGKLMPSPFKFSPQGESGLVMSELFPNLARCADDMCVIRSMYTDEPNHEPGLLIMHSGNPQPIRPSLGSWASYGLGSENQNLPAYVCLCPGQPVVGPQLWSNAFLPAEHQGMSVDTRDMQVEKLIANLNHPRIDRAAQREQLDLLMKLNRRHQLQREEDQRLEGEIRAYELAFKMQREASDVFNIHREPEHVLEMYGGTKFGQSCLLARRLAEAGVRFTQVYYVDGGKQPWDTHSNNDDGHRRLCADSDRATAALITDLKNRGLLEETLVIWGGEFGRTPFSQIDKNKKKSKPGRDHHATGFSMFMAGGGIKGGIAYGATDELGMHAVTDRVHVHDLHATILHQLGIDHKRLTYRYSGRDFRLTDVHGQVVRGILQG